jgi:hypothetical protein
LISELNGGKFTITDEGLDELSTHGTFQDQIESQFNLINKLGLSMFAAGKFLAEEALDRISSVTTTVRSKVGKRSDEAQKQFEEKYEAFLLQELEKLKSRKTPNTLKSEQPLSE